MTVSVGLDVGARSGQMSARQAGKVLLRGGFEQTPADHQRLAAQLLALAPTSVVMEATGIYHLDLAIALDKAGLPVFRVDSHSLSCTYQ